MLYNLFDAEESWNNEWRLKALAHLLTTVLDDTETMTNCFPRHMSFVTVSLNCQPRMQAFLKDLGFVFTKPTHNMKNDTSPAFGVVPIPTLVEKVIEGTRTYEGAVWAELRTLLEADIDPPSEDDEDEWDGDY